MGVYKEDFTGWSVFQPRSKPSGQEDHSRFSGTPHRVFPYSTTKYGLIMIVVFKGRFSPSGRIF